MLSNEMDKNWQDWKIKYIIRMREFYEDNKKFIDLWIKSSGVLGWNNKKYRKLEWSSGNENNNLKDKIITIRQSGLRIRRIGIYPTQVAVIETPIIFDKKINMFRRLTVREVARLQSFPEKFIPHNNDRHALKQLGNAVNVEVATIVAKGFIK